MTDFTTMHNDEFIRRAYAAAESPVGGEYTRMFVREALRRLEIADEVAGERARTGTTFGHAITGLKEGKRYARKGWNGKGMFIYLVGGSKFTVNREPLMGALGEGTEVNYLPHIDMKTADGSCVPWLASQADMLADDWVLV